MAIKRPIMSMREELRELGQAADDVAPSGSSDWLTPEFWTMVVSAVANLITVGVVLGWVSANDAEMINKSFAALIGAAQVIVVNAVIVWKYISARVAVREAMIDARYRYMEAIAVERIRAEKE
jgi:uncharacterized membrane protein